MPANVNPSPPNIIVICGPTGIGKTAAGIKACQAFNGQIISADSMQVYRHMEIGTAKPTAEEQRRVRHHLIDVVEPDQPFDAAKFSRMARKVAEQLLAEGCPPFVVGGTGLYIKAMLHGLFKGRSPTAELRRNLRDDAQQRGPAVLYRRLQKLDPQAARRLHPNDTYRVLRALETVLSGGKRLSEHHRAHRFTEVVFQAFKIGLEIDRKRLYRRIDDRVDKMIAAGLLEEVEGLLERGYGEDLKAMQSIGYRHMVDYMKGRLTWKEAVRTLKRDTRRFAKRQFTWFKADPGIQWTSPEGMPQLYPQIEAFLKGK